MTPKRQWLSGFSERWLRTTFYALLTLLGAACACSAFAASGVLDTRLRNGMRVVIVRNQLAPVVSTTLTYFVGADQTPRGFPGTAHAIEHMMFRGSPGLSAMQLADVGSAIGGNYNANTQQSVTQYLYTVPADDLDIVLRIEALRMRGVAITPRAWQQERGALLQEIAQDLSSPTYILSTRLRAAMFAGSSYAHDALGTRASFLATKAADLQRFHRTWYAPNNALLVVVGDVDPAVALQKIKVQFESVPARKLPARGTPAFEPVKARSLALDTNLPYALRVIAVRMPGFASPDYAAVQVLADVLNSRRGPLYALVPEGKALATQFVLDSLPHASLAYAIAATASTRDTTDVQAELRAVLIRVAEQGVAPDLVEAAKLAERRDLELQKNSISGLGAAWSQAIGIEGRQSPDEALQRLEKVTADDVKRVARRYLDLDRAITAVLTPKSSGKPVQSDRPARQERVALADVKPTALPEWARRAVTDLKVPVPKLSPTVTQLPNGITLMIQPVDISDTVSVYGHVNSRPELRVPQGKEGMAEITDELFSYGTERLDRLALQAAYDAIGAEARAGRDFAVQSLAENFERAVELLAENVLRPGFRADAFKVVKKQVYDAVESRLSSPAYLAERATLAALFPADDPAQRVALPASVESIGLDDVRDYHRQAFRPDLTTIVVMGNISVERARAAIEKNFGAWSATGPTPPTDLPAVPPNKPVITNVPDTSRVQDRVTLAHTTPIVRSDPDYYALQLGNTMLGGAFYSTRLSRDIRMSAGLVYGIDSTLDVGKTRGVFSIEYACDPVNVSRVHNLVMRELEEMQKTPAGDAELQRAKALLVHQLPLTESSVDELAQRLIRRHVLGLPLDEPVRAATRYLQLSAEDVRAAFAKHVQPERLVRVSEGPTPR